MKRLILAGLAGGVVVFVWGAVSWMVLPWHAASLHTLPASAFAEMKAARMATGVYCYPGLPPKDASAAERDRLMEACAAGPGVSMMVWHAEGNDPRKPGKYLGGLSLDILAGLLV